MKRLTVFIGSIVITLLGAVAQSPFGVKAGVQYSDQIGAGELPGHMFTYLVGLTYEHRLGASKLAIVPELLFSSQGIKSHNMIKGGERANPSIEPEDITTHFTCNYLNVPVMLRCYVSESIGLDFGPQLGVNVASRYSSDYIDKKTGRQMHEGASHRSYVNSFDVGIGAGVNYRLPGHFSLQARYTAGLIHVIKGYNSHNGCLSLSVGYNF